MQGQSQSRVTDYVYDSVGNITQEKINGRTIDYKYNKMNQLISKTGDGAAVSYEYDKKGNLTRETQSGKSKTYTYDSSNRMVLGRNELGESSEYIYNGIGQRVENIQIINNPNYAYRNNPNSPASESAGGSYEDLALEGRPIDIQKTFVDNFGQTRQSQMATIHREYVPDPASGRNTDLMVYEEGSYVTKYTYGYERLKQIRCVVVETSIRKYINLGNKAGMSFQHFSNILTK